MEMASLPSDFSELEPFAEKWSRATEPERYEVRLSSTMEEMQAFYDAIFPRVQDALAYCDKFPLDDMPEDAIHLLQLLYSFVAVSFAVELWGQPYVPDTRGTSFDRLSAPLP
ncbi:MAG: hypothetical protein E6G60_01355 [Actinobacteria bacterium]|jgi:hypothetical protein|nr:MAG: hypothetical protein E6G60_01355 [Actinomycetota bacterium]